MWKSQKHISFPQSFYSLDFVFFMCERQVISLENKPKNVEKDRDQVAQWNL